MTNRLAALICVLALASASPAFGQTAEEGEPEELVREGVERLMRALELFIEMIPQYEMPVINEDGDIIIRRKRPEPDREPPADKPELDKTAA